MEEKKHIKTRILFPGVLLICLAVQSFVYAGKKEIVFQETLIEGKIKRPQVVLITADQRPAFMPMAIQSFCDTTRILDQVSRDVFEQNNMEDAIKISIGKPSSKKK